jgi:hypothetical protein
MNKSNLGQEPVPAENEIKNPSELSDEALDELISENVTVNAWNWPHWPKG